MNNVEYAAYLFAKHGERHYRFARYLTGTDDSAAELCQEVWHKVLRCKPESRSDEAGEFTWLCTITRNEWYSQGRRKKARIDGAVGDGFEGNQPRTNETLSEAQFEKKEQIEALRDCIIELPSEFRAVLELRYGCELLTYEQISALLNIPPGTVGSRANRGKKLVADCMERKGYV